MVHEVEGKKNRNKEEKKVKIGVDLRPLQGSTKTRGIGAYIKSLIHAMTAIDKNNEYVFFIDDVSIKNDLPLEDTNNYSFVVAKAKTNIVREKAHYPKKLYIDTYHLDVFFQTDMSYWVKASQTPIVIVAYDLIPLIYKNIYFERPQRDNVLRQLKADMRHTFAFYIYQKSLKQFYQATKIVSISEATKKDFLHYLPRLKAQDITVTPLAAVPFKKPSPQDKKAFNNLGITKPYIAYVTGIDYRKNIVGLIELFNNLHKKIDLQLLLVGKDFTGLPSKEVDKVLERVQSSPYKDDIVMTGYVNNGLLKLIYQHMKIFVFPSFYEGFGLPVLEAMQNGVPTISLNTSCISEVASTAAILVDKEESLEQEVLKLWNDAKLQQVLKEKGLRQATKFTWEKTAQLTIQALELAAGNTRL